MLSAELSGLSGATPKLPWTPAQAWITHTWHRPLVLGQDLSYPWAQNARVLSQSPPVLSTADVTARPLSVAQAHSAAAGGLLSACSPRNPAPPPRLALDHSSERPSSVCPKCELSHE